ncbi:MAG: prepilin-type N-terminal cleavage/methylation domain-containing protein [Candidatus Omnitrophota bacterium]|jgi:type II secretory pathway pseudopilin PulG
MSERSVTLLELLVVVAIVAILISLAWNYFGPARERFLDKEAVVNLKLIQVAEKIYKLEYKKYWDSGSISDPIYGLNPNLRLSLPADNNRNWNYVTDTLGGAVATRNGADGRTWSLAITEPEPHSP